MSTGLLFGCDFTVAKYVFSTFCQKEMTFDRAIGIVDKSGRVTGGVIFQNWNGPNVEGSYYGRNTLTPGIVRCLARFIIETFDPARVTITTSKRKKPLMRSLQKIGFRLEGVQRRYYGNRDCARNTAVRFVMFRERLDEIAKIEVLKSGVM